MLASLLGVMLIAAPAPAVAGDYELHVPVLMYHRIKRAPVDARLPLLWIAPSRFRAQLRALARRGWRTITADELGVAMRAHRPVGPKRFVITIDDGARDGLRSAAPIMESLGFRGAYCVVPGRSWRPWQLSTAHLRRLHAAGHEIANHSLTHADLSSLSPQRLRREVGRSSRLIARRVGHPPGSFCYPYGHHDLAVRRAVARTGHILGFTTVHGARQSTADPWRSPRIRVNGTDTPMELLAKMRPFAKGGGRMGPTD